MRAASKALGLLLLAGLVWCGAGTTRAAEPAPPPGDQTMAKIEAYLRSAMAANNIPGLALVVVDGESVHLTGFGQADLASGRAVTPDTLFEIGSCTKAFTGLAAARMQADGLLSLSQEINRYLPLYYALWQGRGAPITLEQLLHHTSGIPSRTIMDLPPGDQDYAWQATAIAVAGVPLDSPPGKIYEYATINYDLVAAAMQAVSGQTYEAYMARAIFQPLGLEHTLVGAEAQVMASHPEMARGYKRTFGQPRAYVAPVFRGDFPAGYVISSARDLALWLKFQVGVTMQDQLSPLLPLTHDLKVPEGGGSGLSYALGWEVAQGGTLSHAGVNPTFTAYVAISPATRKGLAILTNSNATAVDAMGQGAMNLLLGQPAQPVGMVWGGPEITDAVGSLGCLLCGLILLGLLIWSVCLIVALMRGGRAFTPLGAWRLLGSLLLLLAWPLGAWGLYLLPQALLGGDWQDVSVWLSGSVPLAAALALAALTALLLWGLLLLLFPKTSAPRPGEARA